MELKKIFDSIENRKKKKKVDGIKVLVELLRVVDSRKAIDTPQKNFDIAREVVVNNFVDILEMTEFFQRIAKIPNSKKVMSYI